MIHGLVITPPVVGRISIGRVVERNGKRLPEKDDQLTLTTQVQGTEGWIPHPLDAQLRTTQGQAKLRSIPIRLLFNDPDLNLRADYSLFDRASGRPVCVGNGETCRRVTGTVMESLPCPSPDGCALAKAGCKPYGRLNVQVEPTDGAGEDSETFIFRTTGVNSIRTLAARLRYFQAVSGDVLSCLPLSLRLRAKTTAMSYWTPIYYADITTREGQSLESTVIAARALQVQRTAAGWDQGALDAAARLGFANGAFEDSEEEVPEIVEEFFGEERVTSTGGATGKPSVTLKDKLERMTNAVTAIS